MIKRVAVFLLSFFVFTAVIKVSVRTYVWHRDTLRTVRLLQRTVERQQRFIDGLAEQTDEQADEIARLETALKDASR